MGRTEVIFLLVVAAAISVKTLGVGPRAIETCKGVCGQGEYGEALRNKKCNLIN
jgi:hypothetical protein